MPPTVHKALFQWSDIIKSMKLPIGWYSEECQEANNKCFRNARLHNSRMTSRIHTNEDIIHQMMIQSDPLISSMKINEEKKCLKVYRSTGTINQ